jgi:hypothetical protein
MRPDVFAPPRALSTAEAEAKAEVCQWIGTHRLLPTALPP